MTEKKEKQYVSDNAQLMAEWNWEKNVEFDPSKLSCYSNKKVWWKCDREHEWETTISKRTIGRGCPYCAGQKVIKGINDLQTVNPSLAKEWNYEKNIGITPMDVMSNSHKKAWWKCSKGHEWQASIDNRNNGNSCPYCSGRFAIKGENDLQTVNPTLAEEWNYVKNDGLMPMDVLPNSNKKVWWKCKKGHEWQATVFSRNGGNRCPYCNSERSTSFPEYALTFYLRKYGLEVIHSYKEKGYELDVYVPSKKIAIEYDGYYWHENKTKKDLDKNRKCKKDGIKLYRIREELPLLNDSSLDFVVQKTQKDLPIILEKILSEIVGSNIDIDLERDAVDIENLRELSEKDDSLLFSNPKISNEWNYEKNGNLKPEHFSANSNKKVWWKCSRAHEWKATIASRNNGIGCPYCSGRLVVKGENDLQTVNPTLAKEWNYSKNNELTPMDVMPNGHEKVWWKCSKGHEWEAIIGNRNKGRGCPYCAGKKVLKNYNDLQTTNPTLAQEWNYEKNDNLKPEHCSANSNKKVWWKCNKGHEWQASIYNRNNGNGCPYCSGRYAIKGENDLKTINPTLAEEWNYEKNTELTPMDVLPNSNKKIWWKCSNGHEWLATISSRNEGCGCPQCAKEKRRVIK